MLEYIFLGILQGIFEWIPVSSEGVVALGSHFLLEGVNPVDVALSLHLGTLFAVMIYFWRDWREVKMLRNTRFLKFLTIATVFSLVVGFPLYNLVTGMVLGGFLLVIMGCGLLATSYFHKTKKTLGLGLNRLGVVAGILQGLAVIPGLSRSGSTIFGLSMGKLKPSYILKYSYMMSAPVVAVSSVYLLIKNPNIVMVWPALVSSFIVGVLSLHLLMKVSSRISFFKFTLVFGLLCFVGALLVF